MPNDPHVLTDTELQSYVAGSYGTGLTAAMTALTFPATFDDAFVAARTAYIAALTAHEASQALAKTNTTAKNVARSNLELAMRAINNQLMANPAFTAALAAAMQLTLRDTVPTPSIPGAEQPIVTVDTSYPQRQTVRFMQLSDEGFAVSGKPAWARACRIVYAIVASGVAAPDIEAMTYLASDTASPYTWDIDGDHVGKDIWYRCAWEAPTGEIGPWSDPAKGTVTG
jgi:hypothetical protein